MAAVLKSVAKEAGIEIEQEFKPGFTPPVALEAGAAVYECSFGDKKANVRANDDREAWAIFCDAIKQWPSPKAGKVVKA